MKARDYAEAIYLASQGKDDTMLDRLAERVRDVVHAHGHRALMPAIVRELAIVSRERQRTEGVVVRVARSEDAVVYGDRIAEDVATLGASPASHVTIEDETVVGGYEVRAHGTRIDRTHKRALVEIYNSLITSS